MMDDWEVFFYDEKKDCVSSLTKYHAENCSVEPLVEAHPNVIYFFAELTPHKDWDFNQVPTLNDAFNLGAHYESIFIVED